MKLKALITTLVLASSSLALAAPASTPAVRDHRTLPAPARAPVVQARLGFGLGFGWHKPAPRPVLLANNTHVAGRSVISVAQGTRAFTKLQLEANRGRTDIQRVLIVYRNGRTQVVNLTARKSGIVNAKKSLTIDLVGNARFIKSITLIGKSGRRASLDILAL